MKLKNRLVVVTALGLSLSASIHAQSWKDRSLDLQRAIENERTNFAPSCRSNAFLTGNLAVSVTQPTCLRRDYSNQTMSLRETEYK